MSVTLILGGKGGCGATSMAVNLGFAHGEMGRRVLLADAHPRMGGLALALDLHCDTTWQEALEAGQPLDSAVVSAGPPQVSCLPSRFGLEAAARPFEAPHEAILEPLAEQHDVILADLESSFCPLAMAESLAAQNILIVVSPETAATLGAMTALSNFRRAGCSAKFWLAVNMADSPSQAERIHERVSMLAARILSLELAYAGSIPRDDRVVSAVRHGASVLDTAPKSKAAEAFRVMAETLHSGSPAASAALKDKILAWLPTKKAA
jgi:flagellar biosynthesis protein FlhG